MKGMNRRRFLLAAGAGSITAATAGAAALATQATSHRLTAGSTRGSVTIRAVAGLPAQPLPGYASYVIEGHINLTTHSGVLTQTVFAGPPQAMSTVALPGLSRIIRITDVENLGGTFRLRGLVDDRSQLQPGESPSLELFIDPAQRLLRTNHLGSELLLQLEG